MLFECGCRNGLNKVLEIVNLLLVDWPRSRFDHGKVFKQAF